MSRICRLVNDETRVGGVCFVCIQRIWKRVDKSYARVADRQLRNVMVSRMACDGMSLSRGVGGKGKEGERRKSFIEE